MRGGEVYVSVFRRIQVCAWNGPKFQTFAEVLYIEALAKRLPCLVAAIAKDLKLI